jgi:hypothetical protein
VWKSSRARPGWYKSVASTAWRPYTQPSGGSAANDDDEARSCRGGRGGRDDDGAGFDEDDDDDACSHGGRPKRFLPDVVDDDGFDDGFDDVDVFEG